LIMMGTGFRPGRYSQAASPQDIAATLAGRLNIRLPDCSNGRVLSEALGQDKSRRRPKN